MICNDCLMHTVTAACVYIMSAIMNFQQYSRFSKFVIVDVQGFRPFIITDFNTIVFRPVVTASAQSLNCIACAAACCLYFARSPPPPSISVVIICWNQTDALH